MTRVIRRLRKSVTLVAVLAFFQVCPPSVWADSPIKLNKFEGAVDTAAKGVVPFSLQGDATRLGKFQTYGEVVFAPGLKAGTMVGKGVAVFRAANGHLLVGDVTWNVDVVKGDYRSSSMHFAWRDSVRLSDGTVVTNTGDFVDDKPQNLVVIAIIAILIGLLLPAVQ